MVHGTCSSNHRRLLYVYAVTWDVRGLHVCLATKTHIDSVGYFRLLRVLWPLHI